MYRQPLASTDAYHICKHPCKFGCSIDEQVQAVETNASLSGYDVPSTVTTDPGRLTCQDDVKAEDSEMRFKRQKKVMPTGEDDDEYTLSAFGDISLSNINFVPGPLAALSPEKKANKSDSVTSRAFEYLPKVIRKILRRSPASVSLDFETINNNLKQSREQLLPVTSRKPIVERGDDILYSPQPRHLIDLQNFGIDMVIRSHDNDEPMQCTLASTGNLRANGKHAGWDSGMAQGTGYHLGLGSASWMKLT